MAEPCCYVRGGGGVGASPWQPWTNGSARSAPLRSANKKRRRQKGNELQTDRRTDGRPNFVAIYEFRNKIKTFSENNTPSGRTRIY